MAARIHGLSASARARARTTGPSRGHLAFTALACAIALLAQGCLQDDGTRWNPLPDFSQVDFDQEREIGLQFDDELQQVESVIHDPVVAGFLNDLGQSLVRGIEPQPFVYRFRVIDERSLNAFAVPGGYIYFHSGTILGAGSLDELAGVMGHEIAHVKGRHYARMRQKAQIPSLLATLGGLAVAVAAGEPGALVAGQAINVAVQLSYSREFESEADEFGAIFTSRAGFDPAGSAYFFERILVEQERNPTELPPYLFTHPEVEDRIRTVREAAPSLAPTRAVESGLAEAFAEAQGRLAYLIETERRALPIETPDPNASRNDAALREADTAREAGRPDDALTLLTRAALDVPRDPRVHFQIGEILLEQGRYEGAVRALRRTIRLDPLRAAVFLRLGLAYKALGDRHRAVYYLEQAQLRAGARGSLRERAQWEVLKLTFGVISEGGFADGSEDPDADTPAGYSAKRLRISKGRVAWWGKLSPRFVPYVDRVRVRWTGPGGEVLREEAPEQRARVYLTSRLELGPDASPGLLGLETLLDDEVVERHTVQLEP